MVDEIIRQAESRVAAQLTTALAANQRAMTFFGFLATATALIGSASFAAARSAGGVPAIAWLGIAVVAGLLAAMALANAAAWPARFRLVGNTPTMFLDDIAAGQDVATSRAESAAIYGRNIDQNEKVIERSARLIMASVWLAWGTLVAGGAVGLYLES